MQGIKHFSNISLLFLHAIYVLGIIALYFAKDDLFRKVLTISLVAGFYISWAYAYYTLREDEYKKRFLHYLALILSILNFAYLLFIFYF